MQDDIVIAIRNGNADLIEQLWLEIRDLVAWYAKKYFSKLAVNGSVPGGIEVDDLIQSGFFGVVDAVEHYDPEQGASFTTFLIWYLRKEFQACIGRTKRSRNDALNVAVSLDLPVDADDPDGSTWLDLVPDPRDDYEAADERIFLSELRAAIDDVLSRLPAKEAQVLRQEFLEGKPERLIADELNCTITNVQRIKKQGLRHLRYGSNRRKLEAYIDQHTDFYGSNSSVHSVERKVVYREYIRENYIKNGIEDELKLEPISGHVHYKKEER